jgi:hypothetical protein
MQLAAPSTAVAAWIGVGVLLGAAAVLLGGLALAAGARRRRSLPEPRPSDEAADGGADDDLTAFLEHPPGSWAAGAPDGPRPVGGGFVALGPAAAPARPAPPPPPVRTPPPAAVAGLAALLLVAAAGLAAATAGGDGPRAAADRPAASAVPPDAPTGGVEVRMRFAGVVLEQHAVGITATYPEVEVASDDRGRVARVTLPTWNCLSGAAPDDPVAAGCAPSRTEHAELRPPALDVTRIGDGLRFAGAFPTSIRPTGGPPEPTGREYDLVLVVTAAGPALGDGSREAVGHLRIGEGTARAEGRLHPAR